MATPNIPNCRSAATQAAVDRYAADPAAKAERSIELALAHHLSARVVRIERAADEETLYDPFHTIVGVTYRVPSASDPCHPHAVTYDAAFDSATCDCPAGVNGLPCGHQGAALTSGRALVKADAQVGAARAAQVREMAAWHVALDAMEAHEQARRASVQAQAEAAILYRNQRPFSIWRSDAD